VLVYSDKTAVVHGEKRFTYCQFGERVYRLADALKKCGVKKGDKVAFLCPNIPPMLEAHYAVPLIGAALVSINIRLSASEVSYIIEHSDAKVVVVDSAFASLVVPAELPGVETFVTVCDVDDNIAHGSLEYEQFLATGKIQKFKLRDREWQGRKRIN
jgi:fatty-acyl-CoA synthase